MKFPAIDANSLSDMAATLTRPRLSKYLHASKNNLQQALRLYVFNTKISAAVMTDLHYIEIGLRNKFDLALQAKFNQQLEKLRQLRNRVAHHEPIFHLDLLSAYKNIFDACSLLCPATANVMRKTSTVRREVMSLTKYCQHRGL